MVNLVPDQSIVPVQSEGLIYYQFTCFPESAVVHGIFSRNGGYSAPPWKSLNFGFRVGDLVENVEKNHRLAFNALGREEKSRFDVHQVHGAQVAIASPGQSSALPDADIVLTQDPRVTLIMRYADCVPILIYDPEHHVAGLVHAGWRGTVMQAAQMAVRAMEANFHSDPASLITAIGPCICADHYQVGAEVLTAVEDVFGKNTGFHQWNSVQRGHLDLAEANKKILILAGVKNIAISGLCTACDVDMWYSHRAEKGMTGRFAAVFGLRD